MEKVQDLVSRLKFEPCEKVKICRNGRNLFEGKNL